MTLTLMVGIHRSEATTNMATKHTYCLKCRKIDCNLKEHDDFKFRYTDKLRVPNDWTKRAAFRKFLDACPEFVNCVEEAQRPLFIELLRDVKYFNKTINGNEWTQIKQ